MTDSTEPVPDRNDQQRLDQKVVKAARAEAIKLVGLGGLLLG
jgi:hypothetical protein